MFSNYLQTTDPDFLGTFIGDDTINHILADDMQLASFLNEMPFRDGIEDIDFGEIISLAGCTSSASAASDASASSTTHTPLSTPKRSPDAHTEDGMPMMTFPDLEEALSVLIDTPPTSPPGQAPANGLPNLAAAAVAAVPAPAPAAAAPASNVVVRANSPSTASNTLPTVIGQSAASNAPKRSYSMLRQQQQMSAMMGPQSVVALPAPAHTNEKRVAMRQKMRQQMQQQQKAKRPTAGGVKVKQPKMQQLQQLQQPQSQAQQAGMTMTILQPDMQQVSGPQQAPMQTPVLNPVHISLSPNAPPTIQQQYQIQSQHTPQQQQQQQRQPSRPTVARVPQAKFNVVPMPPPSYSNAQPQSPPQPQLATVRSCVPLQANSATATQRVMPLKSPAPTSIVLPAHTTVGGSTITLAPGIGGLSFANSNMQASKLINATSKASTTGSPIIRVMNTAASSGVNIISSMVTTSSMPGTSSGTVSTVEATDPSQRPCAVASQHHTSIGGKTYTTFPPGTVFRASASGQPVPAVQPPPQPQQQQPQRRHPQRQPPQYVPVDTNTHTLVNGFVKSHPQKVFARSLVVRPGANVPQRQQPPPPPPPQQPLLHSHQLAQLSPQESQLKHQQDQQLIQKLMLKVDTQQQELDRRANTQPQPDSDIAPNAESADTPKGAAKRARAKKPRAKKAADAPKKPRKPRPVKEDIPPIMRPVLNPGDPEVPYEKPGLSIGALVRLALVNAIEGALPVKNIYAFITEHFPYYIFTKETWRNSIRHTLSINNGTYKLVTTLTNVSSSKLWTFIPENMGEVDNELLHFEEKTYPAIQNSMVCPAYFQTMIRGQHQFSFTNSTKILSAVRKHVELTRTTYRESGQTKRKRRTTKTPKQPKQLEPMHASSDTAGVPQMQLVQTVPPIQTKPQPGPLVTGNLSPIAGHWKQQHQQQPTNVIQIPGIEEQQLLQVIAAENDTDEVCVVWL